MAEPDYHGRTHLPNGTDPIPGSFGLPPIAVVYDGDDTKPFASPDDDLVPFNSGSIFNDTQGVFSIIGGAQAKQVVSTGKGLYELDTEILWVDWGGSVTAANELKFRVSPSTLGVPPVYGDFLYDRRTTVVDDQESGNQRLHTMFFVDTDSPVTWVVIADQDTGSDQELQGLYFKIVLVSPI